MPVLDNTDICPPCVGPAAPSAQLCPITTWDRKTLIEPPAAEAKIEPPEPAEPVAETFIEGSEMPLGAETTTMPPFEDEPVAVKPQELQLLEKEPGVLTNMLPPEAPDALNIHGAINEPLDRLTSIDPPVEFVELVVKKRASQFEQVSLPELIYMDMFPGLPCDEVELIKLLLQQVGITSPE
jgi:hypothetical protein